MKTWDELGKKQYDNWWREQLISETLTNIYVIIKLSETLTIYMLS
jgi:hypothetical protein